MTSITVLAPCAAFCGDLAEVPDEAFATGMLGEGLALDPLEGKLRAPFDGEVAAIAGTGHAVTLRHASGAEILLHVGIDTVRLGGRGFDCLTTAGASVRAGEVLLSFDLDLLAREARSLMSPLILLGEGFHLEPTRIGTRVHSGEAIAILSPSGDGREESPAQPQTAIVSARTVIGLHDGLHARPAARVAAALKPLAAEACLSLRGVRANARSITSLLKLDARRGDSIEITASGPDAEEALVAVMQVLAHDNAAAAAPVIAPAAVPPNGDLAAEGTIWGLRASAGGAMGPSFRLVPPKLDIPPGSNPPGDELLALSKAVAELAGRLRALAADSEIAGAHLAILTDPELQQSVHERIAAGESAAAAWRTATRTDAAALEATGNPLLVERRADLLDVERQVLGILLDVPDSDAHIPAGAILIADELLPSAFHAMDLSQVAGVATAKGGPTSHAAILAAARGLPMIVACGPAILGIRDGTRLVMECDAPVIHVDPPEEQVEDFADRHRQHIVLRQAERDAARSDCLTADGRRVEVFANCGSALDAQLAESMGAEGCGLLRTEFLFLGRSEAPTLDEQVSSYREVAVALQGRPLIIRTLDAGSDKPLPFLPIVSEENPALGMRGIRLSLAWPGLLEDQLRAILLGVPAHQRRIMLPMVSEVGEVREVRQLLRRLEAELAISAPTPLGIMVETPAAALLTGELSVDADFLSVGSNDLAQYVLAADRQHAALAAASDALHPAVLRAMQMTVEAARQHGRWAGICGTVASDPVAAGLLLGLGFDELSAAPAMVPAVKAAVRDCTREKSLALLTAALQQSDAASVRRMLEEEWHAHAL